jgi:hypothetical protein
MLDKTILAGRPRTVRSGLTNNPHKLDGVDMRTRRGRRYRDIVDAVIAEFGSGNPVALRELAGLRFTLEQIQARVVTGDPRACEDLVRVSNLVARREGVMREAGAHRDQTPSLAEYVRQNYGDDE